MRRVYDYTKKNNMKKMTPIQREFMAKMIVKEVEKYAREHDVSAETVYELYSRGMLGADRKLG